MSAKIPLHSHPDGHKVVGTDSDVQTVRALMYFEMVFVTGEIQALFYSSASSHSIFSALFIRKVSFLHSVFLEPLLKTRYTDSWVKNIYCGSLFRICLCAGIVFLFC